jgi:CubicO group peptidase (beta-lactamase class C family)
VNVHLSSWILPENKFTKEKKVMLRHLLSHSGGITVSGFRGYAAGEEVPSILQVLNGEGPANSAPIRVSSEPGKHWRYSEGGYCIAQQLTIDSIGGDFPGIMEKMVLEPVGMKRSTYLQPLPEKRSHNAATGYRSSGKAVEGKWHTYPEMAAAGLWTTSSDLARFAIEIQKSFTGKTLGVLSNALVNEMLTRQIGNYGLGLSLRGEGESLAFSHSGGNEGFRCYMFAYTEKDQGAVVMTNSDNGNRLFAEILRSIAAEYEWNDFIPKKRTVADVNPSVYQNYIRKYLLREDFSISITFADGKLLVQSPDGEKVELLPASEFTFFATDPDIEVEFVANESGKALEMRVEKSGDKLVAKRIK